MRVFVVKLEVVFGVVVSIDVDLGLDAARQVLLLQHLLQVSNVLDGVTQCVDFRHLLVFGGCRDVRSENVEAGVDLFDAVAFAGVSSRDFWRYRRWDGVTERRMESDLSLVVRFYRRCC